MGDDPRVQAYIKGIETGEKANIDALTALEAEIGEDWARFTNHEKRELADRYEKMLQMKEAWGDRQDKTARLIEEGRSITEPYKKQQRLEKASYDQAMKAFEDYRKSSALEADIRESMARQEARSQERIKQTGIRRRMRAMRALKELKKRLIKRIVRNVSFKNFAYDQAAMIKAIQRIFQPSLIEGVNKWIGGKEGPLIREIWSRWRTDEAYREELTTAAGKKANRIAKILDKEWDFISNQEKESLIKAMPKQDWITDLGLVELARENDESIQLDIEEQIINGEMHYVLGENLAKKMKEDLGEELYNRLINKPLAAWSITEAEELAAAVDRLTIEGKHELAARNEARSNLRDRFRDQVKKAIRTTGIEINDDDSVEEKKRKQVKINKIIGKYASGKIKNNLSNNFFDANLRRFTTAMDGGRQGIYTSLLYWGENDAYNAKHRALQTRQQRIDEVMVKNKITLDELYQTIDIPGLDTDLDIFYGNRGRQLTVDDLLYIRRGSQNELTRRAIAYGNLSNAEERAQFEKERDIEKSMSEFGNLAEGRIRLVMDYAHDFFNKEENKKFLELEKAIGQDYDQNGERLNRACIDMFNKPMWREENYVPMNRRDQTGGENENRVIEDLLGIEGVGSKWVNKGFSEKRINISPFHQMPIELGLYKTWASSVEATEHLVAYGPLVQNLNNVFKGYGTADVRRTIENRWGKAATGYIDDAIAEMAKPNPTLHRSAADNIIRNLRGAAATAYLAWKLSGILKQAVTSPWPYLQEINPKDYIAAALEVAFGAGKINDFIEEASIFMKNRDPSIMFELIREQMQKTDNRIGHILDKFNTMGMKGLEWIDWAAVAPGWLAKFRTELRRLTAERDAAYEAKLKEYRGSQYNDVLPTEESKAARALEETMGPDEIKYQAVALADDAVRRMQPSSRSTDLAPLFKNRNEAISVFLQFQTALNVIWQNIRYDLPLAMREKKVGTIVGMVTGYAMAGICLGLLTEGLGGDDDDEVTKARNLLFYSFTQFTDSVPVIGNSVTWAAGSFVTGKSRWIGNSAPLAVMDKAFQGIGTLGTLIWEDEEIKRNKKIQRTISLLAEAFGIAAGLPVSGIKELGLTAGIGDGDGELNFNWEALLGRRK
ncbi:MAG: hypothetical protein FWD78_02895 [Treponema sp.]|nr:hypothetical protein [Treponema sp.]